VAVVGCFAIRLRSYFVAGLRLQEELAVVGCFSVYMLSLFFLLVMLGLQATTSLIATKAFEILGSFPISRRDVSKIALLSFLRIFDIPLIVALLIFPATFFLVVRSFFGSLASLFAVVLTEIFALALTIGLAKFFIQKLLAVGEARSIRPLCGLFTCLYGFFHLLEST